jgi:hypothetical protein
MAHDLTEKFEKISSDLIDAFGNGYILKMEYALYGILRILKEGRLA